MGERKFSTRSHVQSFPRAFALSFNVTMSVLIYFAAGQLPGAKTPGGRSRKERTRNALGLNKHRLITITNAVISLFVLSHCCPTVFRSVSYHVTNQLQRAYLANLVPMTLSKKPWERGCPFGSSRLCFPFELVTRPLDLARATLSEQRRR